MVCIPWGALRSDHRRGRTCGGNMLYGYQNCAILPEGFANLSLPAFLLASAAGAVYGVGVLVLAMVLEWRHRRIARDTVA
ncbi:MAG: hypothetical protein P8H53_01350 [Paracoccaceae bacterium]|nr:hypothetical protein [Paracoccaceae bacterium]